MPRRPILANGAALRRLAGACLVAAALAGCQTTKAELDQDCVTRHAGARALSKVAGFAAGLTGVPLAGAATGRAVGFASRPDCAPLRQAAVLPAPPRAQPPLVRIEPAAPPGR